VTGLVVEIARATLLDAGFRVRTVLEDTDDPLAEGIVLSQRPLADTQAKPRSIVTIVVGRYVPPVTEPAPTP
jgi:beta-lactam-binding protein with PASTA domain